jgi:hypothetical protein
VYGYIDLGVDISCGNDVIFITSSKEGKAEKKARINYDEKKQLLSTAIYLAFHSALLDIQQQLEKQGCNE